MTPLHYLSIFGDQMIDLIEKSKVENYKWFEWEGLWNDTIRLTYKLGYDDTPL